MLKNHEKAVHFTENMKRVLLYREKGKKLTCGHLLFCLFLTLTLITFFTMNLAISEVLFVGLSLLWFQFHLDIKIFRFYAN